ncbi:hypothetical protein Bcenmc03_3833 [Burkholderia orbicola MC0-3]|uniref:Uncharacterized protein n=1 Tax=Burkholderia orbicola (strain MC0-3) TaxID=406425 RepID=B1K5J7_BURO0|nr:hypothetical protein Bcenmc03_3833 [Burkholderia orbicola MC0-3]AQT52210.1 hypothetical protein BHQ31_19130 [Burkholderia cenocepacia]
MNQDRWNQVDAYFSATLVPSDAVLDAALAASDAAGLPAINVAPNQGKLLQLLATTAVQTVGQKGWDGFSISIVGAA